MSSGWAYAVLGGLGGYGTGLAEERKREAEEAKAMNLARFQQGLNRENALFTDELGQQAEGRKNTREDMLTEGNRAYAETITDKNRQYDAGLLIDKNKREDDLLADKNLREDTKDEKLRDGNFTDENNNPITKDKFGKFYDASGAEYNGPVYTTGAKPQPKELSEFDKKQRELASLNATDQQKLQSLGVSSGISEAKRISMEMEKAKIIDAGGGEVTFDNVSRVNTIQRELGYPEYEKIPKEKGDKSKFDRYQLKAAPAEIIPKSKSLEESVMQAESGGNQSAVSPKGAKGTMQLMDGTAKDEGVNSKDKFENAAGGISYLGKQRQKYGNDALALVAYNWGPSNTDKWITAGSDPKELPKETRDYVAKVLKMTGSDATLPSINKPPDILPNNADTNQDTASKMFPKEDVAAKLISAVKSSEKAMDETEYATAMNMARMGDKENLTALMDGLGIDIAPLIKQTVNLPTVAKKKKLDLSDPKYRLQ